VIGWALPSEAGQAIAVVFKVAAHIGIGAAFWYVCERPFVAMRPNLKNDNAPSFQKRLSSELRSSAQ
jgi:peptidoglycan/LPS O-acetylase OafA/YrhL